MAAQLQLRPQGGACFTQSRGAAAPRRLAAAVRCAAGSSSTADAASRRTLLAGLGAAALLAAQPAEAIEVDMFKKDLTNKRRKKTPLSDYSDGPQGLKYYDVVVGTGAEAVEGKRVVVHYEAKWKGVTFHTTRQGMGVTGGSPLGFDVGARGAGGTLRGLDLGVQGMRVGGRRKLIVPPELGYGNRAVGELPPNASIEFDVELLSIKQDARGYQVKLVEG